MDLALNLLRITVRAFYSTEHTLIVDALAIHSTLTDADLAHILGMQTKALRRLCGKLKEDGLISVQSRGEKKEGAPPAQSHTSGGTAFKERLFYRDWYYLNFHKAIDSVKYHLWRLSRHIESLGAPTTEKKDLVCPRCKASYTELEVMDNISSEGFLCHMCGHLLDAAEEADAGENESMKRLNDQLSRIVAIMRQIDGTNVPENDFDTALSHAVPIARTDLNPARKMQIVDDARPSLESTKGMNLAPEQISVSVLGEQEAKQGEREEIAAKRRAQEAKQNMLPEWISKSTISGDITSVGAKEQQERAAREAQTAGFRIEDAGLEEKKEGDGDSAAMDDYWKELKAAQERERLQQLEEDEEEEDDDDDDEFEDVDVGGVTRQPGPSNTGLMASVATPETSGQVSSTATDDEDAGRAAKRARTVDEFMTKGVGNDGSNDKTETKQESDEDEDDLQFEDIQ